MGDKNTNQVVVTPQKKTRPTAKGLGITTDKPKYPEYADVAKRRKTFRDHPWPNETPVSVDALVEAGLVYTGVADNVRCFFCGGGLRNWDMGDVPMIEHARWYPECAHVKLVKGQRFIQQIADGEPVEGEHAPPESISLNDELALKSPAALAVMESGYDRSHVLKAIHIIKHRTGTRECKAGELLSIAMELDDNPGLYEQILREGIDFEDKGGASGSDEENGADSNSSENLTRLQEENKVLKEKVNCKICKEKMGDIVLLPCGHRSCPFCAPTLTLCFEKDCNKAVNGYVKVFYATRPDESTKK